jgi:hypothetical protein
LGYISLKNFTLKEDRVVRIPSPRIPIWKLEWSAITPRRKGLPPIPKIIPIEIIRPRAIALSDREVNFETAERPTGKKARERKD